MKKATQSKILRALASLEKTLEDARYETADEFEGWAIRRVEEELRKRIPSMVRGIDDVTREVAEGTKRTEEYLARNTPEAHSPDALRRAEEALARLA